jgi:hypothetical protein
VDHQTRFRLVAIGALVLLVWVCGCSTSTTTSLPVSLSASSKAFPMDVSYSTSGPSLTVVPRMSTATLALAVAPGTNMPPTPVGLIPAGPAAFDLARDDAGRLWAATEAGLLLFENGGERWQPTEITVSALVAADGQGGLWAVLRSGEQWVYHFDGEHWRRYPGACCCWPYDVVAGVDGKLWMTSPQCDLLSFDGREWTRHGGGLGIRGELLARGSAGELYVVLNDDGIRRYDGATWQVLPPPDPQRPTLVSALVVDPGGGLWVGYQTHPYLRYFDGSRWHAFTASVALPVRALLVDSLGRLWVGGERALLCFDGASWQRMPANDWINALAEDRQGRIWVSGSQGLYVYNPAGG